MSRKMKAAFLIEAGKIELKEVVIPKPLKNEVLVKIKSVGLCGSDIHYYQHGRIGSFVVEKPLILGHEAAGEIVALGENVKNLTVGQRVTIEPGVTCGVCHFCKSGRYNLCSEVKFMATPPIDGAFCEYVTSREDFVYPIPDDMTFDEAALAEPISVGIHAIRRGRLEVGEKVVIMGMGPIGILTAMVARTSGASKVIGVDFEEKRLNLSKKMGVTDTINLSKEDFFVKLNEITGGQGGVDLAFETAGNSNALQSAIKSVRKGGRVVVVGMPPEDIATVNINEMVSKEIDILGLFRYANTYETALKIIASRQYDLTNIMTDFYSLNDITLAFEKAIVEKANTIKIMIK